MVLQKLGDRSHLIVLNCRVARRKRRLMIHDDFPGLVARVQVVNEPVAKARGVCRKRKDGCALVRRIAEQKVVKQVRIGVQEDEVRVAVIE